MTATLMLWIACMALVSTTYAFSSISRVSLTKTGLNAAKWGDALNSAMQQRKQPSTSAPVAKSFTKEVIEEERYVAAVKVRPAQTTGSRQQQQPWQPQTDEAKTAREKARFQSKIYFDDETYQVLKTAIEMLNRRINEGIKLTTEESDWFSQAADVILADAHKFGPPPKPERKPAP